MTPPNIPQATYAKLWKELCSLYQFTPLSGNEMMQVAYFGATDRSKKQAALQKEFRQALQQHGFTHILYLNGKTSPLDRSE